MARCDVAQRQGQQQRQQQARQSQFCRRRRPFHDALQYGPVIHQTHAPVAADQAAQIVAVLHEYRLIQMQGLTQRDAIRRHGCFAQQRIDRIARHQMQQKKHQRRHPQQGGNGLQQPDHDDTPEHSDRLTATGQDEKQRMRIRHHCRSEEELFYKALKATICSSAQPMASACRRVRSV